MSKEDIIDSFTDTKELDAIINSIIQERKYREQTTDEWLASLNDDRVTKRVRTINFAGN